MGFSYKQSKEMFGEERAKQLFDSVGVNTKMWRIAKPKRELTEKEYMKLKEDDHGKIFKLHVENNYPEIKFTHIWWESWQSWTRNIIIMMAKKKALWTSKWVPDYMVVVRHWDLRFNLYIELKKAKWPNGWLNWSSISVEQIEWLIELNKTICTFWHICHWSRDAINILTKYMELARSSSLEDIIKYWNDNKEDKIIRLNKLLLTLK